MTRIVIVIRWRNLHQRFTLCLPAKLSERCQQKPMGRNTTLVSPYDVSACLYGYLVIAIQIVGERNVV